MKSIAVFCASSEGNDPIYMQKAYAVGKYLAEKGYRIVFGGGKVGSMGAVARGGLENGGEVIGVLPHFLRTKEVEMKGLTEMIFVDNMHERKLKMNELSDGSISLPGGFGTLEEFFEIITWGQLGLHTKPSAILNVNDYYTPLLNQFNVMLESGLLQKRYSDMLLIEDEIENLLERMENYVHPVQGRIMDEDQS
tara:strand:- start:1169 stop:1750 length:582 start_codon:yes stop_codon:yes gene_type:complete